MPTESLMRILSMGNVMFMRIKKVILKKKEKYPDENEEIALKKKTL